MNQFAEQYKTFSNSDLLKMLRTPDDYQTDAVVAAKNELSQRQLSDVEIEEANSEIESELQERLRASEKRKAIENKVKGFANSIAETVNPLDQTTHTTEKQIKLVVIVFGLMSLVRFYKEFDMLQFMFLDDSAGWDFSMVLYFVPLFVLPTATALFWLRKKAGWVLLTSFLVYASFETLGPLRYSLIPKASGILAFDGIYSYGSPITYLVTLSFFVGCLWLIQKPDMRTVFDITRNTMVWTYVVACLISGGIVLPFLF